MCYSVVVEGVSGVVLRGCQGSGGIEHKAIIVCVLQHVILASFLVNGPLFPFLA